MVQRKADDGNQRFRRRWALGTMAGWFGGFLLGFVVADSFSPVLGAGPWQGVLAYFILGACLGAMVGLVQWRILRRRISGTGSWVVASAAGMGLAGGAGYGIAVLLFGYSEDLEDLGSFAGVLGWAVVVAVGGALVGGLQSRALRGRVARAGRWVLGSSVGWGLSMAAAGTVMASGYKLFGGHPTLLLFLGGLAVGGATFGVISGVAIARLLTRRGD